MNLSDYEFIREAYLGDGGFSDGSYIDKFPRESDEKYSERKNIAYYTNLFASKINRYIGYLYKTAPMRTISNNLIRAVFDDVDSRGNSVDVFMSSFAKNAKALGGNLLLIDMPSTLPNNLKEQLDTRALPYFVEIEPHSVVKYKMDKFGKFEYISFNSTIDNSTYDKEDIKQVVRYYDSTEWRVYDGKDIIDRGTHNLGVCPVISFGENGTFPDVGEFNQIAHLQKRHYNLKSELDEILRGQTFSLLTVNADSPSDIELKLSTDNAIVYGKEMTRPSFIAPESASASIYQKEIQTIEDTINKIAYDISTNQSQESGIALDIKFQGLNGSLSNFAMRLEDFEIRAFDVVARYLQIQNADVTIQYPKTFNIVDVEKEISTLSDIKSLGYALPTYEKLKLHQIVANDLNSVGNDDLSEISSEIDDVLKQG